MGVLLAVIGVLWLLAAPREDVARIVILQTTDTHCAFGMDEQAKGSWLRLASVVAEETRMAGGPDKRLLVDCGDAFQGSVAGCLTKGKMAVDAMRHCGYDAFIPGNHDFDFGTELLRQRLDEIPSLPVCANLRFDAPRQDRLPAWKLFVKNNARIAVIGMTSPRLDYWLWGERRKGCGVTPISEALDAVMPDVIAAKPDLIILAVHHPLRNQARFPAGDDLRELCRKYPQINLVLGGHSHQLVVGEKLSHGAWFIQPGSHGEYLAKVVVDIDRLRKKPPRATFELVPAGGAAIDRRLAGLLAGPLAEARSLADTPLGVIPPREGKGDGNNGIVSQGLTAQAMVEIANADMAVLSVSAALPPAGQPLTYGTLFDALPYEDTVGVLSLTKAELTTVIAEMQEAAKRNAAAIEMTGIKVVTRPDGKTFELVPAANKEWRDGERRRVAFSGYDIAGAGNRLPSLRSFAMKPEVDASDIGVSLRDAMRRFIQLHQGH